LKDEEKEENKILRNIREEISTYENLYECTHGKGLYMCMCSVHAVQYSSTLHTTQYSIIQHSSAQYSAVQYSTMYQS
jgi:hypothetical protein